MMRLVKSVSKRQLWAWLIGFGVCVMAIHNYALTAIDSEGLTWFFLPSFGVILALMATLMVLIDYRDEITFGPKWVWIPLAIIAVSIMISEIIQYRAGSITISDMGASLLFAMFLFGVYLASRILGSEIFKPFTCIVVIMAVSCVVIGFISPGIKQGGIASPSNYDMATGLLVFGAVVSVVRHQWWLWAVAIVGLFFTGADEAIFVMAVLFVAVLGRGDWSKKILVPIGALVLVVAICTPLGITRSLYFPAVQKVSAVKEVLEDTPVAKVIDVIIPDVIQKPVTSKMEIVTEEFAAKADVELDEDGALLNIATGYRWIDHWALSSIKPFGYGYNIDAYYFGIPHNVILIIIEQVGVMAAIAWMIAVCYCLIKTKWKYAFIAVLALGVFDHFIWSQVAPWIWVLAGVATASQIKSDKVFKGVQGVSSN